MRPKTAAGPPLFILALLCIFLIVGPPALAEPQVTVSPMLGPLSTDGSADDPAIWIHPSDPSKSLIFGSDLEEGIYAWDFSGREIQHVSLSALRAERINNLDVRTGFALGDTTIDILAGNLRDDGKLAVLRINPNWGGSTPPLTLLAHAKSTGNDIQDDSYGFALYKNPANGRVFAFERPKSGGKVRQYLLDGASGSIRVSRVRDLDYSGGTAEGFVADDELGFVYITEETKGVHKYYAAPDKPAGRLSFFASGDGTASDREGLALYRCSNGTGYLILSSQGNSRFKVYAREGLNAFLKTFTANRAKETGGVDATSFSAPGFPDGFAVLHNGPGDDYFVYDWADIAQTHLALCPNGSSGAGGGGESGNTTCSPACSAWSDAPRQCGTRTCRSASCANTTESRTCASITCTDEDRDGYGTATSASNCTVMTPDCDDTTASRRPNATEVCGNGVDENCNAADDVCPGVCVDNDRDGYGLPPANCANSTADCNDGNASIRPNATEICGNQVDENCAFGPDESCCTPSDCDGDCDGILGLHCGGADCMDANVAIRPNRTEVCDNGIDDNCNTYIDGADIACRPGCTTDRDRDGYVAGADCGTAQDCDDRNRWRYPGAREMCGNRVDEDCDGADLTCGGAFVCDNNLSIGGCTREGYLCLPNRTLDFNCYLCPCPRGRACVDNVCVRTCSPGCPQGFRCQDNLCVRQETCIPDWRCGSLEPAFCPPTHMQHRSCVQSNCPDIEPMQEESVPCDTSPCGNGRVDAGEDCDVDAGLFTCASLGPGLSGDVGCRPNCRYDTSPCCFSGAPPSQPPPGFARCRTDTTTGPGGLPWNPDGNNLPEDTVPQKDEEDTEESGLESPKTWRQPVNLALFAVILGLVVSMVVLVRRPKSGP